MGQVYVGHQPLRLHFRHHRDVLLQEEGVVFPQDGVQLGPAGVHAPVGVHGGLQEAAKVLAGARSPRRQAGHEPQRAREDGRLLQPPVDTYGGMHPSWAQLYSVLWEYNALFLKEDIAVMSEVEAEGLVAYVDLLAQVLERGTLEDLEGWIKDLAGLELPGLSPFHWDVVGRYAVHPAAPFFLLQQQPVPIRMKAALLGAVASFSRHAASVETLWSILNQAEMLRQGKPQRLVQGTVRTDVTYQLAEVESRAAEYSSTLALVRLLNRLGRAAQDGHCTFPTHSAPYARFVQESVFCGLAARKYRREEQKWELASECLRFIRSCVAISVQQLKCQQGPRRGPQDDQMEVGGAAEAGLAFISDLFLRGRAFGALMGLLEMGVDGLRALRQESSAGAAAEEAVKEALGLLHQAMITEESLLSALRQRSERETVGMQSLPAALQQREIHTVLEYVEYPFLPAIQRSSVELATLLESSRSDLLSILMSPRTGHGHPAGLDRVQFLQRLLQGYSQCLADGSAGRGGTVRRGRPKLGRPRRPRPEPPSSASAGCTARAQPVPPPPRIRRGARGVQQRARPAAPGNAPQDDAGDAGRRSRGSGGRGRR